MRMYCRTKERKREEGDKKGEKNAPENPITKYMLEKRWPNQGPCDAFLIYSQAINLLRSLPLKLEQIYKIPQKEENRIGPMK